MRDRSSALLASATSTTESIDEGGGGKRAVESTEAIGDERRGSL